MIGNIYMSINDKVIQKRQDSVKLKNEKLIKYYNNLSFWERLFTPSPDDEVVRNWYLFREWMERRISKMSR